MSDLELGRLAEQLFQGFVIDRNALTEAVISGNILEAFSILITAVIQMLGNPLEHIKEYIIALAALGIGAALLKQLGLFVKDSAVQKIGFWIIYLVLARLLINLYYNGEDITLSCLNGLIKFGEIFIPVFAAVLTLAAGSFTGAGYTATLMLVIYLIEQFLLVILVPVTEGYMLLCLLGALWQKDRVEKLMDFFEKSISLGFKAMLAVVTGLGILQSMILPYVDQTKTGTAKKIIEMLPGVGTITGNMLEILGGSAVLLKNGIGVLGILLVLFVTSVPLIKIGLLYLIMKLTSVMYGLLGEKHLAWCTDKLGMAELFLLKITLAGMALFVLWIVLAVYTTNQRLGM